MNRQPRRAAGVSGNRDPARMMRQSDIDRIRQQAELKCARIERGENPTPVTKREAKAHLIEEFTDVNTCAKELSLSADPDIEAMKIKRFYDRLKEIDDDHIDEDIQAAGLPSEVESEGKDE